MTAKQDYTYGKKEKLKSRKLLDQVFREGRSFTVFPLKVFYARPAAVQDFAVKLGVGSSGRFFRKAVHRNRIKRVLREAYRYHKQPLHNHLEASGQQVVVFLLYIDKVLPEQGVLQQKMPQVIQKLIRELNEAIIAHT